MTPIWKHMNHYPYHSPSPTVVFSTRSNASGCSPGATLPTATCTMSLQCILGVTIRLWNDWKSPSSWWYTRRSLLVRRRRWKWAPTACHAATTCSGWSSSLRGFSVKIKGTENSYYTRHSVKAHRSLGITVINFAPLLHPLSFPSLENETYLYCCPWQPPRVGIWLEDHQLGISAEPSTSPQHTW